MGKPGTKKKPKKRGRPPAYRKEYADLAYKFCLLGADDERLAQLLNTSLGAIGRWKNRYPEFREALNKGKVIADAEVAEALYHRGKGYSHPSEKLFYDSKTGEVIRAEITRQYPPDTAAAFIWLKNRQGWRNEVDGGVSNKGKIAEFMESLKSPNPSELTEPE